MAKLLMWETWSKFQESDFGLSTALAIVSILRNNHPQRRALREVSMLLSFSSYFEIKSKNTFFDGEAMSSFARSRVSICFPPPHSIFYHAIIITICDPLPPPQLSRSTSDSWILFLLG